QPSRRALADRRRRTKDNRWTFAARVRAFVERQVPASGRSGNARLREADADRLAVGVRRPDVLPGRYARSAQRRAHAPVGTRCAGPDGSRSGSSFGPRLAQFAGYGRRRPDLQNAPHAWEDYRRGLDYYDEDVLNWLWVDVIIRQQTKGAKSLDDFCKLF